MYRWGPLLLMAAQIALMVHVIRTGRSLWWLLIIWFLPPVGAIVYFLVELLPELRGGGGVGRLGSGLAPAVAPRRNIRRLEEELEISDTVKNRQLLARAYAAARRYDEAVGMYESCLKGIYEDDPPILLALAEAQFDGGTLAEAQRTVGRLVEADGNFRPLERRLLEARIREGLDQTEEALREYGSLARQYPGEEARCRYGLLLERVGRTEEARQVFQRVLLSARRSPRYYRKTQRRWIAIAKQHGG